MTDEDLSNLEAQNQTIDFEIVVKALLEKDVFFPPKLLYRFSNINSKELTNLTKIWESIATRRRLALLEDLENLSERDFLMSFNSIFKMAIEDTDPKVRMVAIRALWDCEDPWLTSKFIEIIDTDEDINTRAQAASGLGRFVYLGEVDEISSDRKLKAEKKLFELLDDESIPDKIRQCALESIGFSSTSKVEDLIENGYENGNQEWKQSALIAMGRSGEKKWSPFVVENLDSIDESTQIAAIKAAGEIALTNSVPYLIELLEDYSDEVRNAAIWALSEIGGEQVLEMFERLLEESDDDEEIDILESALENLEFNDGVADFDFFDFPDDEDELNEE
jgi:hypothetical protein